VNRIVTPDAKPRKDSLDQSVDGFIDWLFEYLPQQSRRLLILATIVATFWLVVLPNLMSWLPIIGYGALMLFQLMFAVMFMIVQFVALFWFLGRGRVYWVKPGETGVGFKDYKGNPEVLESARRIVTLLRGVKEFKQMGGEAVRGLLLVGPPGTGKSYLAQAISTEAGVPFGYASAPSFQNMFMGIGNLRVMMLYGKARKLARKYGACILFIDEIDAMGAARANQGASTGMGGMMFGGNTGMLNELLLQMDPPPQELSRWGRFLRSLGLRKKKADMPPVLTIGATNLAEVLDPALLRPGRFDRKIVVDLPSADGRKEILDYYLAKVNARSAGHGQARLRHHRIHPSHHQVRDQRGGGDRPLRRAHLHYLPRPHPGQGNPRVGPQAADQGHIRGGATPNCLPRGRPLLRPTEATAKTAHGQGHHHPALARPWVSRQPSRSRRCTPTRGRRCWRTSSAPSRAGPRRRPSLAQPSRALPPIWSRPPGWPPPASAGLA